MAVLKFAISDLPSKYRIYYGITQENANLSYLGTTNMLLFRRATLNRATSYIIH